MASHYTRKAHVVAEGYSTHNYFGCALKSVRAARLGGRPGTITSTIGVYEVRSITKEAKQVLRKVRFRVSTNFQTLQVVYNVCPLGKWQRRHA